MSTASAPLRILLVSFVADNRWSGMGKWTHSIADSLEERGHSVTLWFADDFPEIERMGRAAVLYFPVALARRLWEARRDFDVVVVHEPAGYWYGRLRRLSRSLPPMIAMSHGVESRRFDLLVDAARKGFAFVPRGTRVKTPLMRLWQSDGTLRTADGIICLSAFDRDYLTRRIGVSRERVELMINGVAPEHFHARQGAGNDGRVLFVAGWLDAKGSYTLPSLWRTVRARFPGARMTLVGTGAGEASVLEAFAAQDRASLTVIPRLTSGEDMLAQYAGHDVFLMPSLNEGSPLSLLEAMAAGLAAVAGRAGGIPDIVTHDVDGLLFDPLDPEEGAEQLSRVIGDADLRRRLGEAAQRRARELDWMSAALVVERAALKALGRSHEDASPGESSALKVHT